MRRILSLVKEERDGPSGIHHDEEEIQITVREKIPKADQTRRIQ
jgi:hypothetical protein